MDKAWSNYEEVAAFLLNRYRDEFGLSEVQPKQSSSGTATTWEIDAKGIRDGSGAIVLIECRRYPTRRINQKDAGSIAYQIIDTAADGAIVVTPIGLQAGAARIAECNNIVTVRLPPESTNSSYVLRFLNKVIAGDFIESVQSNGCVIVSGSLEKT